MLRQLRSLTEPFTNRYRHYLPLPTSTPRGSVSAQGGISSGASSPVDVPSSPVTSSSYRGFPKKSSLRRKSLYWHLRLLVILIALAYTAHIAVRHFFFPPSGSSEEARTEALTLLGQQLATSKSPQASFTASDNVEEDAAARSVHRLFRDRSPGVASREVMPIRAYDALSDECIEEWVVHHTWGDACRGTDLSQGLKFDAVWAWVNGSDPHRFWRGIRIDLRHRSM